MGTAILLSLAGTCGFGTAIVLTKFGLRYFSARIGAMVSIPCATVLFWCLAPFLLDFSAWDWHAVMIFALVGLFFPAMVTLLVFEANDRGGPIITGTVSCISPLFAMCGAVLFLGETITPRLALGAGAVVTGIMVLSWQPGAVPIRRMRGAVGFAVCAAAIRGIAQGLIKIGLAVWPSPFAAGMIGYSVSTATVAAVNGTKGIGSKLEFHAKGVAWFALVGFCNGAAVLVMYLALSRAPVTIVSPLVSAHPLVTLIASAVFLRTERINAVKAGAVALTVAGIAVLSGAG